MDEMFPGFPSDVLRLVFRPALRLKWTLEPNECNETENEETEAKQRKRKRKDNRSRLILLDLASYSIFFFFPFNGGLRPAFGCITLTYYDKEM